MLLVKSDRLYRYATWTVSTGPALPLAAGGNIENIIIVMIIMALPIDLLLFMTAYSRAKTIPAIFHIRKAVIPGSYKYGGDFLK